MTDELSPSTLDSTKEFGRALLSSARIDEPSISALAQTANALGLDPTSVSTLASASGAATAGAKSIVPALVKGAVGLKLALLGVGIGLAGAAIWWAASEREPSAQASAPPKPHHSAEMERSPAPPTAASLRAPELLEAPAVTPEALPLAPALPIEKRERSAGSLQGVSIADEVAAVDRARQALKGGRALEAIDEIATYRRSWPNGAFTTEVLVLRVEALLAAGQRDVARREAQAFIETQPKSRYAERLRALFDPSELE